MTLTTGETTVLCVVAHPDDEVLGAGGTLHRHAVAGDDVHVCILNDGVAARYDELTPQAEREINERQSQARSVSDFLGIESVSFHEYPNNAMDSVPLLDITKTVEAEIAEHEPDFVYTHHYGDLNVDHERSSRAVMTATRPLEEFGVKRVLAFETLSSSEWSTPRAGKAFQPTVFVDIEANLDAKLNAMAEYDGELRESPHPRTLKTIRQNAELWGAKSGLPAAEPFELLRELHE